MVQRKIYFFINGVVVVSKKPDRVRELPEPWPTLLDGSWERAFNKPWIEVFADFLVSHGLNPSHFELHFPNGRLGLIFWSDEGYWDWKLGRYWDLKRGERSEAHFWLWVRGSLPPASEDH